MKYCVSCEWSLEGIELEDPCHCPKCTEEIRDIKSSRLVDLMKELNDIIISMDAGKMQANPKALIEVARTIEKGEKRLAREYARRLEDIKDVEYELMAILKFAERMNYKLEG